jgi:hypothetical protein
MLSMMPSKPPLLPWIGQFLVPLGLAVGDMDFALLSLIVLTQALTLWIIWLSGHEITRGNCGLSLLGVLIIAAAPLFVGMSHQYLVEAPQTLIVALSFYLALIADRVRFLRLFILLALLITAGFAVKTTTLAYCGLAWLIILFSAIQRLRVDRTVAFRSVGNFILLAMLIGALIVTVGWYLTNASDMLAHIRDSTSSETAELYGRRAPIIAKLAFWLPTANDAFFLYPGLFLCCFAVIALGLIINTRIWYRRAARFEPTPSAPASVASAAFIHLIAVLLLLSSQIAEESRYLVSLLAPLALAVIWAINRLGVRRMAIPLCALAFTQLVYVHLAAHGLVPNVSKSPWLLAVKPGVDERDIADAVERETCPLQLANRYTVIGAEFQSMNANSIAYETAKARIGRGYRCYYTSLGYAETNIDKAIERLNSLNASFIVLPLADKLGTTPDAFNIVSRPMLDFVSHNKQYALVPHHFGDYQIYQRGD